jgi:hypothetical protein
MEREREGEREGYNDIKSLQDNTRQQNFDTQTRKDTLYKGHSLSLRLNL